MVVVDACAFEIDGERCPNCGVGELKIGAAVTNRQLLLAAVGKAASHANQTTLYLTPLHGRAGILKRLIANIGAALKHVRVAVDQFRTVAAWDRMLRYVSDRIAPVVRPRKPPPALRATG